MNSAGQMLLPRPRRRRSGLLLWIVPLFAVGCDACGCGGPLAELVEANGDVARDYDQARLQWVTAGLGSTFEVGDAVRTTTDATARVTLRGGGGLKLVENTVVRFLAQQPDQTAGQVSLEVGEAAVTAGGTGLAIVGGFGRATVAPGSALRVSAEEGRVAFKVLVGSARLEGEGFDPVSLAADDPEAILDLELGEVVIEGEDGSGEDAGPPDAGVPDAGFDAGPLVDQVAVETRGTVQVMDEEGKWARLDRNASELPVNSRVRVRPRGRVVLRRGEDSVTVLGPSEFSVPGAADRYVNLLSGRASASSSQSDLGIGVPGGAVTARAGAGGSNLDIGLRRGQSEVRVSQGSSELRASGGDRYVLRSGQSAVITSAGAIEVENRAPARAHLALTAGSSASIHDPSSPVAVMLRFGGACPGEGVVEVGRSRSFGVGSANVGLRPGRHRYTVKCAEAGTPVGNTVARGTLTVLRDSGRSRLPVRPPRNVVDTDGRRYTLLYQNLLPIVTVRWPRAPEASQYVLVVERAGAAAKRVSSAAPQATLESGDVPEGVHRVYFEAGEQRSPTTTMTVGYDNAASAVFLREPGTAPVTGSSVAISGIAMEGWSVSAGGSELNVDNQFRFTGTAPVPSDVDAVAVRLTHPRHGVHYYLRRIAR